MQFTSIPNSIINPNPNHILTLVRACESE